MERNLAEVIQKLQSLRPAPAPARGSPEGFFWPAGRLRTTSGGQMPPPPIVAAVALIPRSGIFPVGVLAGVEDPRGPKPLPALRREPQTVWKTRPVPAFIVFGRTRDVPTACHR